MVEKSALNRLSRPGGPPGVILRTLLRLGQVIVSISILAIFGSDLTGALQHHHDDDERSSRQWRHPVVKSDWIYGVIVASASLLIALVYLVPKINSWRVFFVDAVMALGGWLVLFGIWGKNYIPRECHSDSDCKELKMSAWFSLAGWLLWTVSAGVGAWLFENERRWTHGGRWWDTIRGGRGSGGSAGYPHSNV